MKLKTLALLSVAGWLYKKGPKDPHDWPAFLGEHVELLKRQGQEAVAAGKQAAARRQDEIDRDVAHAMGREHTPRV